MFMEAWSWFLSNIFTKPAWFLAILVFIGCLLIKKPLYESFASFIKALVGYMIFSVASGGMISNFRPILLALNDRFNLQAAVIDPYFGVAALQNTITVDTGRTMSLATMGMIIGFAINILMVLFKKQTKVRTLMVGGHVMNMGSWVFTAMVALMCPQLSDLTIMIMVGVLNGLYWGVGSNMTLEPTQELTDGADMAVGHAQMFGIYLIDKLATAIGDADRKKGKEVKKVQDVQLPGFMSIFNDTTVAASVVMLFFFGAMMLIIGKDFMATVDASLSGAWGFYVIEKCLTFVVYMNILMLGLRMFVGELTEAFTGISQKMLNGAVPAVDCAATFGFTDGSVLTLGFLFGALGSFIAIALSIVFNSPILAIVGFIPMFFDNATLANFANNKGGFKALVVATLFTGVLHVVGGGIGAYFFNFAQYGGISFNFDGAAFWTISGIIWKNLGLAGIILTCVIWIALPQIQYALNKDTYFLVTEDFEKYKEIVTKKRAAKLAGKK